MPAFRYTVSDVMSHTAIAIGREASYKEIVELMHQWKVSALPVLEGEGRVVGEEEVRHVVLGELPLPAHIEFAVLDGVVTLRGPLRERALVPLLARAIRAVEGVVDVRMDLERANGAAA